jgi:2-amino-4-hydroxy-6-hydroxymethyldihydropteridine diphosphokinase
MNSRTTSASALSSVVVALGSNLGRPRYNVLRAIDALGSVMTVVRISSLRETEPVDAPPGSPNFINAVVVGYTTLSPLELMEGLLAIERRLGRIRRGPRNAPRTIDLDLIIHGGHRIASRALVLPHPRAATRAFVREPMREVGAERWLLASEKREQRPLSAFREHPAHPQ